MIALLADAGNLADFYNEPFWVRLAAHGAFMIGALYLAARMQADGLTRRPSWRYWQVACVCFILWNATSLATVLLRASSETGAVVDETGQPLSGGSYTVKEYDAAKGVFVEKVYTSRVSGRDISYEGARFVPLTGKGYAYYYLQFDILLLLLAMVFGLLGLNDARRPRPVDEVEAVDA